MTSVTQLAQHDQNSRSELPVIVLGAGPAGLSAAKYLAEQSIPVTVLEQDDQPGGLSRTVEHRGYRFDIGGHRFFSKSEQVNRLWRDVLGRDLLKRGRQSRIAYNSRFFEYPLVPLDCVSKLGVWESLRCIASYLKARRSPVLPENNLEIWLINRFGSRLFHIFFKTYTEKVWGVPCCDISAEWGAQRIQALNLGVAVKNALLPKCIAGRRSKPKSLIAEFLYPRLGPGMMWERVASRIRELGGQIFYGQKADRVHLMQGRVQAVQCGGRIYYGRAFISTIALRDFLQACDPIPDYLAPAADYFEYRDFITVAVIVRKRDVFPDNWIYLHDPAVRAARIQNYKNWSAEMVPDPETTCLGLEYFCTQNDRLWSCPDEELTEIAIKDLLHLRFIDREQVIDARVVRVPKAYPVYNGTHQRGQDLLRRFLDETPNLQVAGRNGLHRYNNQDHAMVTGILAARNISGEKHDVWTVNADAEYLEEYVTTGLGEVAHAFA